jgi:peptidoglycan/LPS O-acetylase OafA/YrhL
MGVSGFFVLSGFLITILLLREHDTTGGISLGRFYLRRVLRIWPAYFTFIAIAFVVRHWQAPRAPEWTVGSTTTALAFVHNWYLGLVPQAHMTNIVHLWSVSIEEQFYLVWPIALIALLRLGVPTTAVALTGVVLGATLWRAVLYDMLPQGWDRVYQGFDTRVDNLAIGCLLAVGTRLRGFDRFASALTPSALAPLVPIAGIVVFMNLPGALLASAGLLGIEAMMAVLILQLLQLATARGWRWLEHPVVRTVGVWSYSLYLYHNIGLAFAGHQRYLPWYARLVLGVVAGIVLAGLSYHVVERPFLALKARLSVPPRRSQAEIPTAA